FLGEDVLLGWRARRAGASTTFCPSAFVEHAVHPRGLRGYVEERLRLGHFPAMVARVPEIRAQLLTARLFLSPQTVAFDAALAAAAAARLSKSPLPLLAAAPYARRLLVRARPFRRRAPIVALVD